MCGIIGCVLKEGSNLDILDISIKALNLLKNRGYDSCGLYLNDDNNNMVIKKLGIDGQIIKSSQNKDIFKKLEIEFEEIKKKQNVKYSIGHSRWATHGEKTDENSHPHTSSAGLVNVVHNGIISNYLELKKKYLSDYIFKSETDTEIIANLIEYFLSKGIEMLDVLKLITKEMEGTWACLIRKNTLDSIDKTFFIKNESPLLIAENKEISIFTSEPSGLLNMMEEYILLRDKTFGYISKDEIKIVGDFKKMNLLKCDNDEIELPDKYDTWLMKEIEDQCQLTCLIDPMTGLIRYNNDGINLNLDFIGKHKYLYIIGCGSSYYAGLIASNYFRFTKAFEFINVIDGGEFTKAHLEAIENPEDELLVLLLSQSGETRDLNLAVTICREFSSNRKLMKKNKLLEGGDPLYQLLQRENSTDNYDNQKTNEKDKNDEIKIVGIINVVNSLISRRTISNIYTNVGRENSVASTKSCTAQVLMCLLLAIYKSEINNKLDFELKNKFLNDLKTLGDDIKEVLLLKENIKNVAIDILKNKNKSIFILGKDELHGVALEGSLKIKEISYIHAEGFNITALKHGPYALLEEGVNVIIIYKKRDHFIKSIVQEIKTRKANVIEISHHAEDKYGIKIPNNRTFTGMLSTIVMQILSYYLSILQGIDADRPRNLAKVVTVD